MDIFQKNAYASSTSDGDRLQARFAGSAPRNEKSPGGLSV
jgi:hypothetical protein